MPVKTESNTHFGKWGEEVAAAYLERKGYRILARNYRAGHAEIDIIASHGNETIVVEVKTRTDDHWGFPELSVGKTKQKNLCFAAEQYVFEHGLNQPVRFDIVTVVKNDRVTIEHYQDAFYPYHTY